MPKVNDMGYGKFNVIRGWPGEGTIFLDLPYDNTNAPIEYGDPVALDATSGKVVKANDATDAGFLGFAIGGDIEPNVYGTGKITVLMSPFVAETAKYDTTATYTPGQEITVVNGQIAPYDPAAVPAQRPIGKVIRIDAAAQKLTFLYTG